MRFFSFLNSAGQASLGAWRDGQQVDLGSRSLLAVLQAGRLDSLAPEISRAPVLDAGAMRPMPLIARPGKLLCVGLNYREHRAEAQQKPDAAYPDFFIRLPSSLLGNGQPLVRPRVSHQFDYEAELAVVIGRGGRAISRDDALDHVAGYALFNDVSVRDYQFRASQWTWGKNFDATGPFGPDLVTPDELPRSVKEGLRIETRLNGAVVQSASTADLIFDVPTLIAQLSEAMTLEPGDVIVTGTPGGVGLARTPPLYMQAGDIVEVSIEGIGVLRNPVVDET